VQPIRYVTPELAQCHVPLANLALALLIYSAIVLVIGICLGQHIKCQRRREPGGEPLGPIDRRQQQQQHQPGFVVGFGQGALDAWQRLSARYQNRHQGGLFYNNPCFKFC
jgi:hypothetical protein